MAGQPGLVQLGLGLLQNLIGDRRPEVAAARQPAGTLMLRSGKLTPAELADEVLARSQG